MALAEAPSAPRPPAPRLQLAPPLPKPRPRWLEAAAQVWGMLTLARGAVRALVTPPFSWRGEFVDQAWTLARRASLPAAISAFGFGYGAPGVQGTLIAELLGDPTRVAAIVGPATVREQAVWITGMVVAGVAGTAICADLGARKVRDELDALETLALHPLKTLVAPRFLALGLMTPCLLMFAIVAATFGGYAAAVFTLGETSAGFFATFSSNFATPDLWGALAKTLIFGFFTAAVSCHLGMTVSGGPEGVGRAVNRMVVIAFVGIWVMNYVVTSFVLGAFPETQVLR